MASKSRGGDLAAESSQILQKLASEVIELSKLREALSEMIETVMEDIAPNIKKMLTPVIGSKAYSKGREPKEVCVPSCKDHTDSRS